MSGAGFLFVLACGAYFLNASFGVLVRAGWVDSSGFRRVHHGLYVVTFGLALAGVSSLWWSTTRAGWCLVPVLAALAVLPRVGSASRRPNRHIAAALVPLPFYILSLIVALTP